MDLVELRNLRGRHPDWMQRGDGFGSGFVGMGRWLASQTVFLEVLGPGGKASGRNLGSCEKIFQKNRGFVKNFICICEKIGYNKVE